MLFHLASNMSLGYFHSYIQGVQDQNFRIQMLISLSIFDLGEKFQVLRRFEKYTFFSSQ